MPASVSPHAHADESREALRSLAHATRNIEDPTEIYSVLGELTNGLTSLAQSLHQIGNFHEALPHERAWIGGDPRAGRAASNQVAWELHRAAEMVHQVAAGIDRAHQAEATITYNVHDLPTPAPVPHRTPDSGLTL